MAIQHHSYVDGKVQSLGFSDQEHGDMTVGVIAEAGEYDFGLAEQREMIVVITGAIIYNRRIYRARHSFIFGKGAEIKFLTEGPTSYLCIYLDD